MWAVIAQEIHSVRYFRPMMDFWSRLDLMLDSSAVVIDRPAGSRHPRYQNIVYPLDYGYLEGVTGGDAQALDLWRGHLPDPTLVAVVCTADTFKNDGEFKLLLGCSETDIATIEQFHTNEFMSCIVIVRSDAH